MTSSSTRHHQMGPREWGLILILSLLWGGSFFFIGVAVKDMTPFSIVFCRVSLAAVILIAVVYLTGHRLPTSPQIWLCFLIMGGLNNLIPFSLITWGQHHIESGLASILNGTTPFFSVLLAHLLTKDEPLTVNRLIGVLIGWLGVTVLIGIDSLEGLGTHVAGQIAVLGAALSYACAAIYGRRFKSLSPLVVSAGMLTCSTILVFPLMILFETPWNLTPSLASVSALLGLAVISTSLAYLIYFKVLATAGATNLVLVTFLIPISAILLGVFILGERFSISDIGGMILVLVGLVAIDGRLFKRFQLKTAAPLKN